MKLKKSLLSISVAALFISSSAWATLGANVSSLQSDRMQMKASLPLASKISSGGVSFTVHEMTLSAGTTIREYANASGTVFGLAWKGPAIPDLRQLMGDYFEIYITSAKNMRTRRTQLSIRQENLVMRASGHMRAYYGIAYSPTLLPQGMNPDDIK